jgi:lipid-A-disaccharide synthase
MIVAGEASGDLHGSRLVSEALNLDPGLRFFGIGGARMRAAGVETLVDASEMAVVGLVEGIAHFGVIYGAYRTLKRIMRHDPPDLLILIDYPDFNLHIAQLAKRAGVKVLYYISPQIWAWRGGRAHKIARLVDRIAVVFPFEVPLYERVGAPVTFVGHPLVDAVRPTMSRSNAQTAFGLDPKRQTVGLFPGSRKNEIKNLFSTILASAKLLKARFPELQFILPLATTLSHDDLEPSLSASGLDIRVVEEQGYDVMQVCDAIITVSGTVTLEIALIGVPMVIIYRVSPLTYEIGKRLVRIDHAGLCNIVAGERVVPELIQNAANAESIAEEIIALLTDNDRAAEIKAKLGTVREKLGEGGCSKRVAELAIGMLTAGVMPGSAPR